MCSIPVTIRGKEATVQDYRQTRDTYYKERADRMFGRGFALGVIVTCVIVAAFIYGQREAYGATRPAPAARAMSHIVAGVDTAKLPPTWRTLLRIGMCEQPKPGISWHDVDTDAERFRAINWKHDGPGVTFPGGLGLTTLNWTTFRPRSARNIARMSQASISQQLWAGHRLWAWAERTYPGNGHTAWECSYVIGWTSSDPQDALR